MSPRHSTARTVSPLPPTEGEEQTSPTRWQHCRDGVMEESVSSSRRSSHGLDNTDTETRQPPFNDTRNLLSVVKTHHETVPASMDGNGSVDSGIGNGKRGVPLLRLPGLPTCQTPTIASARVSAGGPAVSGQKEHFKTSGPPRTTAPSLTSGAASSDSPSKVKQISVSGDNHRKSSRLASARAVVVSSTSPVPFGATALDEFGKAHGKVTPAINDCKISRGAQEKSISASTTVGLRPSGTVCCRRVLRRDNAAINLVLALVRASIPASQRHSLEHVVSSMVDTAKILNSLLPAAVREHDVEEIVMSGIQAFSNVGAMAWISAAGTSDSAFSPNAIVDTVSNSPFDDAKGDLSRDLGVGWLEPQCVGENFPSGLDTVDIGLLVRCINSHPSAYFSEVQTYLPVVPDRGSLVEIAKSPLQRNNVSVPVQCRLALERTWLTRILHRRIGAECCPLGGDHSGLSGSLSAEVVSQVVVFCGECLRKAFDACCRPPGSVGSPEHGFESFLSGYSKHIADGLVDDIDALLLVDTAVVDLTLILGAILRWSTAWGQDLEWAASIHRFMAHADVGAIPALVGLLDRLMKLTVLEFAEGDQHMLYSGERESNQARPRVADSERDLGKRKISGGSTTGPVLHEFLLRVLGCLQAVLFRSTTIMDSASNLSFLRNENSSMASPRETEMAFSQGSKRNGEVRTSARTIKSDDSKKYRNRSSGTSKKQNSPIRANDEKRKDGSPRMKPPVHSVVEHAVSKVISAMLPLFQPKGCVLALLQKCSQSTSLYYRSYRSGQTTSATGHQVRSLVSARVPTELALTGILRLSTGFFSLWGACDLPCDRVRPENHVTPLFSGLLRSLGGRNNRGRAIHGPSREVGEDVESSVSDNSKRRRDSERTTIECATTEDQDAVLSQLYLDALVGLTSIKRDPAVHDRMRKLRVARVLLREILTPGAPLEAGVYSPVADTGLSARQSEESVTEATRLQCQRTSIDSLGAKSCQLAAPQHGKIESDVAAVTSAESYLVEKRNDACAIKSSSQDIPPETAPAYTMVVGLPADSRQQSPLRAAVVAVDVGAEEKERHRRENGDGSLEGKQNVGATGKPMIEGGDSGQGTVPLFSPGDRIDGLASVRSGRPR